MQRLQTAKNSVISGTTILRHNSSPGCSYIFIFIMNVVQKYTEKKEK